MNRDPIKYYVSCSCSGVKAGASPSATQEGQNGFLTQASLVISSSMTAQDEVSWDDEAAQALEDLSMAAPPRGPHRGGGVPEDPIPAAPWDRPACVRPPAAYASPRGGAARHLHHNYLTRPLREHGSTSVAAPPQPAPAALQLSWLGVTGESAGGRQPRRREPGRNSARPRPAARPDPGQPPQRVERR